MSDREFVEYCSPTLAGIKAGSLFSTACTDYARQMQEIRSINRRLGKDGLRIIPLGVIRGRILVYIYRPQLLRTALEESDAAELLREMGYNNIGDTEKCVAQLAGKVRRTGESDFPHEIGIFLGYPPEDVRGFMNHKYDNCKCIGTWRVYGDEQKALERFRAYDRCKEIYCGRFGSGASLEQLAVSI